MDFFFGNLLKSPLPTPSGLMLAGVRSGTDKMSDQNVIDLNLQGDLWDPPGAACLLNMKL